MKPKVLPELTGATLDFSGSLNGFHPATCIWDLGGMWVEVAGIGMALCDTQWLSSGPPPRRSSHLHHQEGAVSAGAPCYCNPLQGHGTRALPCPHHSLTLLSCPVGADEDMADVLQDVGLRSVSMGLVVLRRCWGNSSLCHGSCSSAQEATGDTRQLQLLGGVQEVVWDRGVLSGKSLGAHGMLGVDGRVEL